MIKTWLLAFLLLPMAASEPPPAAAAAAQDAFAQFADAARVASLSPEGKAWHDRVYPLMQRLTTESMRHCPRPSLLAIVRGFDWRVGMRVAADGSVAWTGIDPAADNASTRCLAERMRNGRYPPPPAADWPYLLEMRVNGDAPSPR